jgi:squalene-hopene/tetraprenyl-beta-curcumene cyclase
MRWFFFTIAMLCFLPNFLTAQDAKTLSAKATTFLKAKQNADGSWGAGRFPGGISGVVMTGLLNTGTPVTDPAVVKGLGYIESLINPDAGHIAGKGDVAVQLHNYVTSVNVMALQAAKRPEKYAPVVKDAVKFLKQLQWDDSEGKTAKDDFYGGAGYDSKSRPDMSNTQFFLDALKEAGVPGDDPAVQKAMVFVSRCQNFKSEFNSIARDEKVYDGSFIYSIAGGGSTKTSDDPKAPLTGYGSMTYAGVKSMIYAGISKDDARYKAALAWVSKNYSVTENPGMPKELAERGLYYYYHTMAKTLALAGIDTVTTPDGVKHDWRAELLAELAKRQQPDGSWVNKNDRWMEGDPILVTGYVLMTLSHCTK